MRVIVAYWGRQRVREIKVVLGARYQVIPLNPRKMKNRGRFQFWTARMTGRGIRCPKGSTSSWRTSVSCAGTTPEGRAESISQISSRRS